MELATTNVRIFTTKAELWVKINLFLQFILGSMQWYVDKVSVKKHAVVSRQNEIWSMFGVALKIVWKGLY